MQQNGMTKELFRFNADGTIETVMQNGKTMTVTRDQAGLNQVREAMLNDQNFYALR
jgi:hypothetical protein